MMPPVQPMPTMTMSTGFSSVAVGVPPIGAGIPSGRRSVLVRGKLSGVVGDEPEVRVVALVAVLIENVGVHHGDTRVPDLFQTDLSLLPP